MKPNHSPNPLTKIYPLFVPSMLCIQEELGQLSLESPDDRSTDTSDIPSQPSLHNPSGINKVEHAGWLDWTRLTKLSVCWRPFCSFVDKFSSPEFKTNIQGKRLVSEF